MTTSITAIVLTFNEEVNIERCIHKLRPIAQRIVVVDSLSTDYTAELARQSGAEVVEHPWPGNQAAQFNWALDHIAILSDWVLRLDADEYLTDELCSELTTMLPTLPSHIKGVCMPRTHVFLGHRFKHGVTCRIPIVRLFRTGCAHYANQIMDEHLVVNGAVVKSTHKFVDDNRTGIDAFIKKHLGYASRQAAIELNDRYALNYFSLPAMEGGIQGKDTGERRQQKALYTRLPLFVRSFAYFVYRYFFRLGCLDGKAGFAYDFIQGWWYRTIVDIKVLKAINACGHDKDKLRQYIRHTLGIQPE